jgi:hypothetical protein
MDATADELETWDASAAEVRAAGDVDDLPLLVVASGGTADQYNLDLMSLSSEARLAELNVGHTDMLLRPDQAELVVETLRAFLSDAGL